MTRRATPGPTRRRVLRTAVNLGVGAGLVWGAGADYAASGDTVSIEYAQVRDPRGDGSLAPRSKTVPADWLESMQTAFQVQRTLREAGLSSLVGSFVVPGSFDDPAASIAVDVTSESAVERLTSIADDVEVDSTVVQGLLPKPEHSSRPDDPFHLSALERREVPGGGLCRSREMSGTLAPAAYDTRRGGRFFLTSNHLYGAAGAKVTEHRDEPLDLPTGGETQTIGRVERGYPEADFVRVSPVDGYEPVPELARAVSSTVAGQFTRLGLADLMARGVKLKKYGAVSGHTEGSLRGVDGFTCYLGEICKPGQLKWGNKRTITDGDSGSVNYAPDPEHPDERVIVGGINNARSWWPGADFTWGTAAFHLLEAYGIHF